MSEMIEKVARAIFQIEGDEAVSGPSWRAAYRAIEAMREPTAEMTIAGVTKIPDSDNRSESAFAIAIHDAAEVWQAMIDEALRARVGMGEGE